MDSNDYNDLQIIKAALNNLKQIKDYETSDVCKKIIDNEVRSYCLYSLTTYIGMRDKLMSLLEENKEYLGITLPTPHNRQTYLQVGGENRLYIEFFEGKYFLDLAFDNHSTGAHTAYLNSFAFIARESEESYRNKISTDTLPLKEWLELYERAKNTETVKETLSYRVSEFINDCCKLASSNVDKLRDIYNASMK